MVRWRVDCSSFRRVSLVSVVVDLLPDKSHFEYTLQWFNFFRITQSKGEIGQHDKVNKKERDSIGFFLHMVYILTDRTRAAWWSNANCPVHYLRPVIGYKFIWCLAAVSQGEPNFNIVVAHCSLPYYMELGGFAGISFVTAKPFFQVQWLEMSCCPWRDRFRIRTDSMVIMKWLDHRWILGKRRHFILPKKVVQYFGQSLHSYMLAIFHNLPSNQCL